MENLIIMLVVVLSSFSSEGINQEYPDVIPNPVYMMTEYVPSSIVVEKEVEADEYDTFILYRIPDKSFSKLGYGLITTERLIFVGAEVIHSGAEKEVLLHEIGHWYTNRNPDEQSLKKEMEADAWAVAHGADPWKLINFLWKYRGPDKIFTIKRIIALMGMKTKESPVAMIGID